jgi:hypothetical protein
MRKYTKGVAHIANVYLCQKNQLKFEKRGRNEGNITFSIAFLQIYQKKCSLEKVAPARRKNVAIGLNPGLSQSSH